MKKAFISLLCIIWFLCGCQKDLLPAPTQEGLNTFGCKINGKAWIPDGAPAGKGPAEKPIEVTCARVKGDTVSLFIYACASSLDRVQLTLPRATPGENILKAYGQNDPAFAVYYSNDFKQYFQTSPNPGKVTITKLDTVNRILSGTFEFTGMETVNKQKVQITEGRFDLRYEK